MTRELAAITNATDEEKARAFEWLRARSIGAPSPAALESLAEYLLARLQERRPRLTLVIGMEKRDE